MISSAPRQPSMIRINITAETTGLPSYHFFFDFEIPVDISLILGNLITVIFDYQIPHKPLKILSL